MKYLEIFFKSRLCFIKEKKCVAYKANIQVTGLCFLPNYKITKIQKDIICFNILNCLTLLTAMLEIHQHVQEGSHLLCN